MASPAPVTLKVGQTVTASIIQIDAAGNVVTPPVIFDAPPVWSVDNTAVATVSVSADGLTPTFTAIALGNFTATVVGVIGGVKVSGTNTGTVADTVAGLQIVFGTPTP